MSYSNNSQHHYGWHCSTPIPKPPWGVTQKMKIKTSWSLSRYLLHSIWKQSNASHKKEKVACLSLERFRNCKNTSLLLAVYWTTTLPWRLCKEGEEGRERGGGGKGEKHRGGTILIGKLLSSRLKPTFWVKLFHLCFSCSLNSEISCKMEGCKSQVSCAVLDAHRVVPAIWWAFSEPFSSYIPLALPSPSWKKQTHTCHVYCKGVSPGFVLLLF